MKKQVKNGFSLVELAIVIVIIGLLIAVLSGASSLIRSSRISSVISDVQGFKTAVNAFQKTYYTLPGDLTNSSSLWTTGTGSGQVIAACANNGDGDRRIENANGPEYLCAWQHLALGGFIPGTYTGTENGATPKVTGGTNAPESKVEGATYIMIYFDSTAMGWTIPKDANYVVFGSNGDASTLARTAITVNEAWTIDSKADDGVASTGDILGNGASAASGTCVNTAATKDYSFATTTKVCGLAFFIN